MAPLQILQGQQLWWRWLRFLFNGMSAQQLARRAGRLIWPSGQIDTGAGGVERPKDWPVTVSAAQSVTHIVMLRFLAGLAMGGATPQLLALAAEYGPARHWGAITTGVHLGLPGGAILYKWPKAFTPARCVRNCSASRDI